MSAILSADDLNDFISPGVACIKPVETLPLQKPQDNPYEVTTEDKLPAENLAPAQISLTDCLACSGCVTSAEAVLVSLQSHTEVLNALDSQPSIPIASLLESTSDGKTDGGSAGLQDGKIFVASVSPQVRASVAATYGISERKAGWMIEQLLSGPDGLRTGGAHGNGFTWVVDTNAMREASLVIGAEEVMNSGLVAEDQQASTGDGALSTQPKKPILTSACPGWICYAEKTHPHVLPHLSRLKSPQALTGTMLKTVLSRRLHISPDRIWHVALMPCFDKKLEASRSELTDISWQPPSPLHPRSTPPSATSTA
ncbi:MAG: Iron-sulfur cluster assembly associated Nar1 [Lasallia pustulata]|uniref:Cytosolic Fe-S cluster assembly factor NAR1 n=1 Tax=Lasallia pustulata TaxID=136370 RepID=A0A5M8PP51_9LECA|nr:MAG: Iron-sulfur cluster assembly associated Nar1 [Lasallia pustulata]